MICADLFSICEWLLTDMAMGCSSPNVFPMFAISSVVV